MIEGTVNSALEAVIALTVSGTAERSRRVSALIDTGYSGHVTLPSEVVHDLGLVRVGTTTAELANGDELDFETYIASVGWSGDQRGITVHRVETRPLIGMRLLEDHRLQVDVEHGGRVLIEPLTR